MQPRGLIALSMRYRIGAATTKEALVGSGANVCKLSVWPKPHPMQSGPHQRGGSPSPAERLPWRETSTYVLHATLEIIQFGGELAELWVLDC